MVWCIGALYTLVSQGFTVHVKYVHFGASSEYFQQKSLFRISSLVTAAFILYIIETKRVCDGLCCFRINIFWLSSGDCGKIIVGVVYVRNSPTEAIKNFFLSFLTMTTI